MKTYGNPSGQLDIVVSSWYDDVEGYHLPLSVSFPSGSLVTGVDRTYKRSIYQIVRPSKRSDRAGMRFVSFLGIQPRGNRNDVVYIRAMSKFRLATTAEIIDSWYGFDDIDKKDERSKECHDSVTRFYEGLFKDIELAFGSRGYFREKAKSILSK